MRLHNVALGAQDDTLTLTRSRFNSGDNRLSRREASPASGGVSVPVRPLDALLEGRPLDFVKIDVQGWELEVFKGMRRPAGTARGPCGSISSSGQRVSVPPAANRPSSLPFWGSMGSVCTAPKTTRSRRSRTMTIWRAR